MKMHIFNRKFIDYQTFQSLADLEKKKLLNLFLILETLTSSLCFNFTLLSF